MVGLWLMTKALLLLMVVAHIHGFFLLGLAGLLAKKAQMIKNLLSGGAHKQEPKVIVKHVHHQPKPAPVKIVHVPVKQAPKRTTTERTTTEETLPEEIFSDIDITDEYSVDIDVILDGLLKQLRETKRTSERFKKLGRLYILFSFIRILEEGDKKLTLKKINFHGLKIDRKRSTIKELRSLARLLFSNPTLYKYTLKAMMPYIRLSETKITDLDTPDLSHLLRDTTGRASYDIDYIVRKLSLEVRNPNSRRRYPNLLFLCVLFQFIKLLDEGVQDLRLKDIYLPGVEDLEIQPLNIQQIKILAKRFHSDPEFYRSSLKAIFPGVNFVQTDIEEPGLSNIKIPIVAPLPPQVSSKPLDITVSLLKSLIFPDYAKDNWKQLVNVLPANEVYDVPTKTKASWKNLITYLLFPTQKRQSGQLSVFNMPDLSDLLIRVKGQTSIDLDDVLYSLFKQLKKPNINGKYQDLSLLYLLFYCLKILQDGGANVSLETVQVPGLKIEKQSSNIQHIKILAQLLYSHPQLYQYTMKALFPKISADTTKRSVSDSDCPSTNTEDDETHK